MTGAGLHKSHALLFHGPLTSDFGQISKVKILVQGRISSSMSSCKLIFHNEDVPLCDQQEYTRAMTS